MAEDRDTNCSTFILKKQSAKRKPWLCFCLPFWKKMLEKVLIIDCGSVGQAVVKMLTGVADVQDI